jgi:RHS repeat-associated protein
MTRFILSSRAWQRLLSLSVFVPQFFVPQYLAQAQGLPIDAGHNSQCGVTMSCGGGTGTGTDTGTGVPGGGGMCAVNPNGNTCGSATGTASVSGQGGLNVGAGNPINLISGNKYQQEVDLPALPGTLGIEIVRHYNSQSRERGQLGARWKLSYETDLYADAATVQIIQADGRRLIFSRDARHPSLCQSSHAADGRIDIRRNAAGHEEFVWTWNNGRKLSFNEQGKLDAIVTQDGQTLTLQRGPKGELLKVIDPQHRSLVMHYGANKDGWRGIVAIDTPVGRFAYAQTAQGPGAGNLAQVVYPDGKTVRRYHYTDTEKQTERDNGKDITYLHPNPHLLTGITVQGQGSDGKPMNQRITTWAYDHGGRAILSTHADGMEKVTLDFSKGGRTVLTNSLNQTTMYRHAIVDGEYRLLEAIGPGCATCGQTNVRYRWSDTGQLLMETKLAPGDGTRPLVSTGYEYDKLGRVAKQSRRTYDAKGKAGAWQWQVRYGYDGDSSRPSLIARPSVVAGKEHVTRIAYNDRGQPTSVTESGWSPTIDAKGQAEPIERTTTYRYAQIGGRSLLAEIDGPLKNGPKNSPEDSDVTRVEWDKSGSFVVGTVSPMNLRQRYRYEEGTGRLSEIIAADGVATRYQHAMARRNEPTLIDRAAYRIRYSFDALDRLSQIADAPGREIRLHYDAGNRLTSVVDAQGYKAEVALDAEGQTKVAGLYEPGNEKPLRATYRWYDEHHRLMRQLRPDGRIDTWRYDAQGRSMEHVDGDGVLDLQGRNSTGLIARIQLTQDGLIRTNFALADANGERGLTATRRDDFGRIVAAWLPGQGTRQWQYDAAGHVIIKRHVDAKGRMAATWRFNYDAAGRQTRYIVLDASNKAVQYLKRRYEGAHLREESDDVQTLRYDYDAAGRVSRTTVELKDEQGSVAYSGVLATAYDPATTQTSSRTLIDGSTMLIERGANQMAQKISLQGPFWSKFSAQLARWLPDHWSAKIQRWLPQQTVVADIGFHPYDGITGYRQGNGIQTGKRFDIAGRLQALEVKGQAPVAAQTLRYQAGPRIRSMEDRTDKREYIYNGFGMLRADAGFTKAVLQAPPKIERDGQGRAVYDGRYRYAYTPAGQIEVAATPDGKTIARYRYNAQGQRISKSAQDKITYYLWQQGKLVAEIDGSGNHLGEVTAQYLYLDEQSRTVPIVKIESAHAEGNVTGSARTLYIHADYRGEPVAMTDAVQRVVWRGRPDDWGYVKTGSEQQQSVLNLRLPGQYYDQETGLHDNWHRSYDARPDSPMRGHYLSPDPLGYPDGPDAYAYVNGDPINRIDPTGLYQIDMHYYMTFFLAVAAGVDTNDARTIATAAQYVDDNPDTQPLDEQHGIVGMLFSPFTNQDKLRYYHFMADTLQVPVAQIHDVVQGNQLSNLYQASTKTTNCLAKKVFFGEFLHALGDTYAHADQNNDPYRGVNLIGLGVGHGLNDSDPDYTFNHWGFPAVIDKAVPNSQPNEGMSGAINWNKNADRTLDAERTLYDWLKKSPWAKGKSVSFDDLAISLIDFNTTGESEQYDITFDPGTGLQTRTKHADVDHGDPTSISKAFSRKLTILNNALKAIGIDIDLTSKDWGYDETDGVDFRQGALGDLKCADYPGVILPKTVCPMPQNQ